MIDDGGGRRDHAADGFLLGVGADFYAWLVERGTVPRPEGMRIAARLSHLSLCTAPLVPTG